MGEIRSFWKAGRSCTQLRGFWIWKWHSVFLNTMSRSLVAAGSRVKLCRSKMRLCYIGRLRGMWNEQGSGKRSESTGKLNVKYRQVNSTLKTEEASFSAVTVFTYSAARRHKPADHSLDNSGRVRRHKPADHSLDNSSCVRRHKPTDHILDNSRHVRRHKPTDHILDNSSCIRRHKPTDHTVWTIPAV
jgi:hypothetical protein